MIGAKRFANLYTFSVRCVRIFGSVLQERLRAMFGGGRYLRDDKFCLDASVGAVFSTLPYHGNRSQGRSEPLAAMRSSNDC